MDLFLALYVNDLFMQRVEKDELWSLFCPSKAPMLFETHGKEFKKWYNKYEC